MALIISLAICSLAYAFADATVVSYVDLPDVEPLPEFLTLETSQGKLYCVKEIPSECGPQCRKADILLVVDTSSSISEANITELTNQLQVFTEKFPVSPDTVRFAAVSFGFTARKVFDFIEGSNITEVTKNIDRIPRFRGATALHGGLNGALIAFNPVNDSYAAVYEARVTESDVAKVVILFTDGYPSNLAKADLKASALKAVPDIEIYAVGVGNTVNTTYLGELVSAPQNLLTAGDFAAPLANVLNTLAETVCNDDAN